MYRSRELYWASGAGWVNYSNQLGSLRSTSLTCAARDLEVAGPHIPQQNALRLRVSFHPGQRKLVIHALLARPPQGPVEEPCSLSELKAYQNHRIYRLYAETLLQQRPLQLLASSTPPNARTLAAVSPRETETSLRPPIAWTTPTFSCPTRCPGLTREQGIPGPPLTKPLTRSCVRMLRAWTLPPPPAVLVSVRGVTWHPEGRCSPQPPAGIQESRPAGADQPLWAYHGRPLITIA